MWIIKPAIALKRVVHSLAGYGLIISCVWLAQAAQAQDVAPAVNAQAPTVAAEIKNITEAHRVVESTTTALVALIDNAKIYIEEDEPQFYTELGKLLKEYVDFNAFARGVMGKYASTSRIASLPSEQQLVLNTQIKRFATIFTNSLINTYGRGLLVFDGEHIEVVEPNKAAEARALQGKAVVKQLIHGDRDQPYEIYYSLRRNTEDEWKIRNMIIESSNLGKIYRNQFDNAYKVYGGDIDKVIDNWAVSSEAEQSEQASDNKPAQTATAGV